MDTLDKIKTLLKEQRKTQKQLMDYLGLGKTAFTGWNSGANTSYNKHIGKIAEFLGVSTDYLLGVEPKLDFSPTEATVLHLKSPIKTPFDTSDEIFIATNREKQMIMEYRNKPETKNAINQIINKENPTVITNDEALLFALYGGDSEDITPDMLEDVRNYANYIRERRKKDNQ